MDIAIVNDLFTPFEKLDRPCLDRGIFFGDGVYEVMRSYHGRIFALDEHLARFQRSCSQIEIHNVDIGTVKDKIVQAFGKAGYDNAKIYFHLTRGSEPRNHLPSKNLEPNFFLTVNSLSEKAGDKETGVRVCTCPDTRWKRCDIKSLNLLPNILARMQAEKKGCSEAILVDDTGHITEGAGSAFFVINAKDKTILTRPLGTEILPSITRAAVLDLAQKAGLIPLQQPVTPGQAARADEMFLAVTTKDIVPVAEFDGQLIGSGKPGKFTVALIELFREMVRP